MSSMTLTLHQNNPIVLIDCSYYVFYRYFATMRWFTFQKKTFEIENITENKEYIESFVKHLQSDLQKICKKFKTEPHNLVFCADCPRTKIWRNEIYSDYKGSRVNNTNFNSNIFNIFNEYINKNKINKIWFDKLEADDVIYLLQKNLKKSCQKIVVITNDNDYLQLADTNVSILNMQFKDITSRGNKDAKVDLFYKIIMGDKSDNIPKISSTISKDKALELSNLSQKEICKWMSENGFSEQFMLNFKLVCFDNIPEKLIMDFYKNILIKLI